MINGISTSTAGRAVAFPISGSVLLSVHLARCSPPLGANHNQPWPSPGCAPLVFMALAPVAGNMSLQGFLDLVRFNVGQCVGCGDDHSQRHSDGRIHGRHIVCSMTSARLPYLVKHNGSGSKKLFWLPLKLMWWLVIKFLSFVFVFVSPHNDPANEPTNEVGQKGVNNCGGDDSYNCVADDFALELVHAVSFQDRLESHCLSRNEERGQ